MSNITLGNITAPEEEGNLPTYEKTIVPIIFGFIFLIGIIGNGSLIFIVLWNKPMRNIPNIYIVSLALGDFLVILISVPFSATIYTFDNWPYGVVICKLNFFMQTVSLGVSVFTLVALAGDRFTAIVNPMSKHTGNPLARTFVTAGCIWVLSVFLAIPEGVTSHIKSHNDTESNRIIEFCVLEPVGWKKWYVPGRLIFRFIVYFAIPVVIIGVFYFIMAVILMISSTRMPGEPGAKNQNKQIEARKKIAKIVLSLIMVFIVCWLPRHIFVLWYEFDPGDYNLFWHVWKVLAFCLMFINSCVNPITLYFLSKQFRRYYNRYLFCCLRKRFYQRAEVTSNSMYNFNSTVRRTSTTMTMLPQSQSM